MYLRRLSLTNFRSLARLDVELPPPEEGGVVLLVGANAQGKTSVLESIYFLAAFTSFQTHADRQMVNFHEAKNPLAVTRLIAEYQRGGVKQRLEARLILEASGALNQRLRKEILLNGAKKQSSEAIGSFNAALFAPQMSQIIEGAPEERRRYLNLALAQTAPAYARALSEYHQAVTQRNALLKTLNERGGNASLLDVWDEPLSQLGAQIILWRIQAIQEMERLAARIHAELTRGGEVLRLAYQPAYDPLQPENGQLGLRLDTPLDRSTLDLSEIQTGFRARLQKIRGEDIARGVTSIGPHRDDLRFIINKADARDYGSRGQIRTALLALKLAEVEWMKERVGEYPVVLLDEVMAELDAQRRADLMAYVHNGQQTLISATDTKLFSADFLARAEIWDVQNGVVTKRK
ncbi:MAG: DNA replication/repair protein RecF [Anaerolineales bacterium]